MTAGKPLPAHQFSEHTSPLGSSWWLVSIAQFHNEADSESHTIKYAFQKQHPLRYCVFNAAFLQDREFLNAQLEGITASDAATAAAIVGYPAAAAAVATEAVEAAALQYSRLLCLCNAWICCPEHEVTFWGTAIDPHIPPTLDDANANTLASSGLGSSGVGWRSTQWADGSGWGDKGAAWGTSRAPRLRWFPRFYGYCRMGATFWPPKLVGWRERQWEHRFGWLRHLEHQWRWQERLLRRRHDGTIAE
ncbi:hypothetical protein K438DRAFT_1967177 [Mycena galopus ATCC 62051]|nr:hypothetical protein K438DRAFT_1967177 [Mycena galopus ATCC 62051]